jgi:hypothetical protein
MVEAVEGLRAKLDAQFVEHVAMDVMGIVYPQYWLQADANVKFPQHLEMLNFFLL